MQFYVIVLVSIVHLIACGADKLEKSFHPPQNVRIVGGVDAPVGSAPYQCSLQSYKRHFCGCAIISNKWIITASHCVEGLRPANTRVLVGTNNLRDPDGIYYQVDRVIKHSRYNKPRFANDIALVRVKEAIKFSDFVKPISYSSDEVLPKSNLQLTGWGRLTAGGIAPQLLQTINLTSISYEECRNFYLGDSDVDVGHLCTLTKQGEGACNGDSGGPLTFEGKLVGIVNWGVPCARGLPDAFAKVSYYHDWIRTNINSNS